MIPKIIHYCWFGDAGMSMLHQRCIESWKKHCPDYELRLWNEHNSDIDNDYCREAIAQRKWAFVSDWVRFDALHKHGGIYLDTDLELIRPLDDLLGHRECVMCWESERSIGAAALFCHPGDAVMALSRDLILQNLVAQKRFTTSPLILRHAVGLAGEGRSLVLPRAAFYPFNPYERDNPRNAGQLMFSDLSDATFGIHHYRLGASWGDGLGRRALNKALKKLRIERSWSINYAPFRTAQG